MKVIEENETPKDYLKRLLNTFLPCSIEVEYTDALLSINRPEGTDTLVRCLITPSKVLLPYTGIKYAVAYVNSDIVFENGAKVFALAEDMVRQIYIAILTNKKEGENKCQSTQ